jgi:hypothetical protein
MLKLLVALLGIVAGYGLRRMAPEEFSEGKKYFIALKWIFLLSIVSLIGYYLIAINWLYAVFFVILMGVASLCGKRGLGASYIIMVIPYFLFTSERVAVAALIFLYGLPVGTLYVKRS